MHTGRRCVPFPPWEYAPFLNRPVFDPPRTRFTSSAPGRSIPFVGMAVVSRLANSRGNKQDGEPFHSHRGNEQRKGVGQARHRARDSMKGRSTNPLPRRNERRAGAVQSKHPRNWSVSRAPGQSIPTVGMSSATESDKLDSGLEIRRKGAQPILPHGGMSGLQGPSNPSTRALDRRAEHIGDPFPSWE